MSISVTERSRRIRRLFAKTALAHFAASLLCVAVANVYALFGHGIRSDSMDLMFLYPLLGGAAIFAAAAIVLPRLPEKCRGVSRAGYNLYNSGIAALTSAAMLRGIVEIAGTGSGWIQWIKTAGAALLAAAAICSGITLWTHGE